MAFSIPVIIGSDGNFSEATSSTPLWFPGGITNDATGDVALKINALPFTTANIAEFSLNGSLKASIDHTGLLNTVGISVGSSWVAVTFPPTAAGAFFGGPTTGANATPAPRTLVASDIPTTLANVTLTGTNAVSNLTISGTLVGLTTAGLPGGNWLSNQSGTTLQASAFTTTLTSGTFQDTGTAVALPAAGTYLITATVRGQIDVNNPAATCYIVGELFNATTSAAVANSEFLVVLQGPVSGTPGSVQVQNTVSACNIITVTGATSIHLYVSPNFSTTTPSDMTIPSNTAGRTRLSFVRLV